MKSFPVTIFLGRNIIHTAAKRGGVVVRRSEFSKAILGQWAVEKIDSY
jgi:hypothetical protein